MLPDSQCLLADVKNTVPKLSSYKWRVADLRQGLVNSGVWTVRAAISYSSMRLKRTLVTSSSLCVSTTRCVTSAPNNDKTSQPRLVCLASGQSFEHSIEAFAMRG